MPQTPSATPSPPPPTLSYSTHQPGEPIVSRRADALDGVEIDIPPQIQRWRSYWPPQSIGAATGMLLAALCAISPVLITGWWWMTSRDRTAGLFFLLSLVAEWFFFSAIVWIAHEVGRRRTTITAGPDGLTITTVGGTAWPRPRHWPRPEIVDLRYTDRIGNAHFESDCVVLFLVKGRAPVIVDGLQLLAPKAVRPLLARLRQALALDPPQMAEPLPASPSHNHQHPIP
jgi:hypothetical protein